MILGLRSAIVPAPDLAAAKAWYAQVFETQPYFDEPFYVGFNIGGFELGLIPDGCPSTEGVSALWGVADIAEEHARILAIGATELDAVKDVGGGIKVSALRDPFSNCLGLIENPQFDPRAIR